MATSIFANSKTANPSKVWLKLQYKTFKSRTEDKFEAWIMTIEDRWINEIAACLQGKFPDWRE